jgi:hypothetical protein
LQRVSPMRQSSKFNGFDWIASSLAVQAPRNDKAIKNEHSPKG